MEPRERLPLIKQSMRLLVDKLTENDHVAIVVYAGASGLALPSTTGDHKEQIVRAIEELKAGGSTNGAKLAAIMSHLTKFKTLGGPISFTPALHSPTGRPYRVVVVNNNVAQYLTTHVAKKIPNIH